MPCVEKWSSHASLRSVSVFHHWHLLVQAENSALVRFPLAVVVGSGVRTHLFAVFDDAVLLDVAPFIGAAPQGFSLCRGLDSLPMGPR